MDNRFLDLLRKWLSGDFRRTDAERLQSLLKKDDFQKEAFEGFAENSETVSEKQISAMRRRFDRQYGAKKVGRVLPITWLAAAAACGILVVATLWIFEKSATTLVEKNEVAMTPNATQSADNESVKTYLDSINNQNSPKESAPKVAEKIAQTTPILNKKNPAISTESDNLVAPTSAIPASDAKDKEDIAEAKPTETAKSEMVLRRNGNENALENRARNAQDYPAASRPAAPFPSDYATNTKAKKSAKTNQKMAEESERKSAKIDTEAIKLSEPAAENGLPTPEIGWPAYKIYILENTPELEHGPTGEVKLKFMVDKNGRPTQILVSKSVGKTCDELAIKMLENGPKWIYGEKLVEISIRF